MCYRDRKWLTIVTISNLLLCCFGNESPLSSCEQVTSVPYCEDMTTEEQVSLTVRCGGLNRVANLTAKQSDPSLIDEIRLEYSCRDSSGQMLDGYPKILVSSDNDPWKLTITSPEAAVCEYYGCFLENIENCQFNFTDRATCSFGDTTSSLSILTSESTIAGPSSSNDSSSALTVSSVGTVLFTAAVPSPSLSQSLYVDPSSSLSQPQTTHSPSRVSTEKTILFSPSVQNNSIATGVDNITVTVTLVMVFLLITILAVAITCALINHRQYKRSRIFSTEWESDHDNIQEIQIWTEMKRREESDIITICSAIGLDVFTHCDQKSLSGNSKKDLTTDEESIKLSNSELYDSKCSALLAQVDAAVIEIDGQQSQKDDEHLASLEDGTKCINAHSNAYIKIQLQQDSDRVGVPLYSVPDDSGINSIGYYQLDDDGNIMPNTDTTLDLLPEEFICTQSTAHTDDISFSTCSVSSDL